MKQGYWVDLSDRFDYYQINSKGEKIKTKGGVKQWQVKPLPEQPEWIKHYPLPVCDNCRNVAQYIHCKIECHVCGMKRDCSDP